MLSVTFDSSVRLSADRTGVSKIFVGLYEIKQNSNQSFNKNQSINQSFKNLVGMIDDNVNRGAMNTGSGKRLEQSYS